MLTTQAESAEALRRWAAGLAELAATVRAADPDLRRLLADGPPAGAELRALLRGLEPGIGTLLGNLVTVNGIAARRLPGIEQLLVVYPIAVVRRLHRHPGRRHRPPRPGRQRWAIRRPASTAAAARNAAPGNAPPAPASAGRRTRRDRPAASRPPAAAPPAQGAPGGYDPATGLVLGPDGRPLQFGGTGGQYRTAGDQSWKQLLLAGVTP